MQAMLQRLALARVIAGSAGAASNESVFGSRQSEKRQYQPPQLKTKHESGMDNIADRRKKSSEK